MFDLCSPTDPKPSRVVSLYLQPQSYTAVPARSKDDLLQIEIHTPSDASLAEARKALLPAQVQTVLHDAQVSTQATPPTLPTLTLPTTTSPSNPNLATCDRIVSLILHP